MRCLYCDKPIENKADDRLLEFCNKHYADIRKDLRELLDPEKDNE